jgi:hypothetical protein
VIYNVRGRTRWFHLGAGNAIGLKEARELARDIMYAVAKGEDPQAEKRAQRNAGTFAELASRYVEDYAQRHNKSWRQADALVRRYLLPKWAKLEAKVINRSDVRLTIGRIAAPVLANQVLAAASAIFSWAVKQGLKRLSQRAASRLRPRPARTAAPTGSLSARTRRGSSMRSARKAARPTPNCESSSGGKAACPTR